MRCIIKVRLYDQSRPGLAVLTWSGANYDITAYYFQPVVFARFSQNFSSSVLVPLASKDCRLASAESASAPSLLRYSSRARFSIQFLPLFR
jgi:hypothetical protein